MPRKIALLQEILSLAATISASKKNPAHVFVFYSGHVDEVHIYGYIKGWPGARDIDAMIYMNDSDATRKLNKIKNYLKELSVK